MSDVATQLRASVEAQARAQDLLDAAQDILKHGNRLFNDVHDEEAFKQAGLAIVRGVEAMIAFWKITEAHDDD